MSETVEWVAQYHYKDCREDVEDFCANCLGKWPCHITRLADAAKRLRESLQCLIHRCEAEGCGTAWAPITDAKKLLKEIK
jgi:hypothetical protein